MGNLNTVLFLLLPGTGGSKLLSTLENCVSICYRLS